MTMALKAALLSLLVLVAPLGATAQTTSAPGHVAIAEPSVAAPDTKELEEFRKWRKAIPDYEKRIYDRVKAVNNRVIRLTNIVIGGLVLVLIFAALGIYLLVSQAWSAPIPGTTSLRDGEDRKTDAAGIPGTETPERGPGGDPGNPAAASIPDNKASTPNASGGTSLRSLCFFVLGAACTLAAAWYVTGQSINPYFNAVDLREAGPDRFLPTLRMPQRSMNDIKLRHVVNFGPPKVAVFGNHAIWEFNSDAAGLPAGDGFMNMYADHIGMPEILDILLYLEAKNAFPRNLILVQIPNPHTAGAYYVNLRVFEQPLYVYWWGDQLAKDPKALMRYFIADMRERWDWRNVVYEIFADFFLGCTVPHSFQPIDAPVVDRRSVSTPWHDLLRKLNPARHPYWICHTPWGYRRDGSRVEQGQAKSRESTAPLHTKPWATERSYNSPYISGDPDDLIRTMMEIQNVCERNNVRTIFFVPPAMEVDRISNDSLALDDVLRKVSGKLTVIDHRRVRRSSRDFADYMHPNDNYYRRLMKAVRELGLPLQHI